MQLYNIKDHSEVVDFAQAVRQGLGRQQGLFFPSEIKEIPDVDSILDLPLVKRSEIVLRNFLGDELPNLGEVLARAFTFPAPLVKVSENSYALELFHGPTLAFKDFGGRFMAQALQAVSNGKHITILTATSGDTGAAVAHAFYGLENIDVVILYPKFDDCQALVKKAFDDQKLKEDIGLNSANSINISRLLAQVCYYFEAVAQLPKDRRDNIVVSVPSGNFGDITAGLLAKACGLRISRFVVATNANDTVPRYLASGKWDPKETIPTLSNAMDVSRPNNWPRVEELFRVKGWDLKELAYGALDDSQTEEAMRKLHAAGYIFLCTAAPAKFKENVDRILGTDIPLPAALAERADMKVLSETFKPDWDTLRDYLYRNVAK